jgi:hypothetical protein
LEPIADIDIYEERERKREREGHTRTDTLTSDVDKPGPARPAGSVKGSHVGNRHVMMSHQHIEAISTTK